MIHDGKMLLGGGAALFAALVIAVSSGCSKSATGAKQPVASTAGASAETRTATAPEGSAEPAREATPVPDPTFELRTAYFELDSARLSDNARDTLMNNAEFLRANPDAVITIAGHTCELGTSEYNVALGERRAQAVRDYIVRLGIAPARIDIISYGEELPADPSALERNRRAEFVEHGR